MGREIYGLPIALMRSRCYTGRMSSPRGPMVSTAHRPSLQPPGNGRNARNPRFLHSRRCLQPPDEREQCCHWSVSCSRGPPGGSVRPCNSKPGSKPFALLELLMRPALGRGQRDAGPPSCRGNADDLAQPLWSQLADTNIARLWARSARDPGDRSSALVLSINPQGPQAAANGSVLVKPGNTSVLLEWQGSPHHLSDQCKQQIFYPCVRPGREQAASASSIAGTLGFLDTKSSRPSAAKSLPRPLWTAQRPDGGKSSPKRVTCASES
jgi:hypothetical protein